MSERMPGDAVSFATARALEVSLDVADQAETKKEAYVEIRSGGEQSFDHTKALLAKLGINEGFKASPSANVEAAIHQSKHLRMYHTVAKLRRRAGRNDPCPCQSGLKHKRCCMIKKVENTDETV